MKRFLLYLLNMEPLGKHILLAGFLLSGVLLVAGLAIVPDARAVYSGYYQRELARAFVENGGLLIFISAMSCLFINYILKIERR